MVIVKMTERKVKYQGLSLPVVFVNDIKKHIENRTRYTSITDFVKQAVRSKMRLDIIGGDVASGEVFTKLRAPQEEVLKKLADRNGF